MEWKAIKNESTFYEIQEISDREKVLIFKYTPDNVVSHVIRTLLQREWNAPFMNMKTYCVDVINHKDVSDQITNQFGIEHNSPQVLVIKQGKCIYVKANGHIKFNDLKQFANRL
jgi:bacillithiol system protein YtxJ